MKTSIDIDIGVLRHIIKSSRNIFVPPYRGADGAAVRWDGASASDGDRQAPAHCRVFPEVADNYLNFPSDRPWGSMPMSQPKARGILHEKPSPQSEFYTYIIENTPSVRDESLLA
jgi:hypothetical protein